jgi:hypothetical protein
MIFPIFDGSCIICNDEHGKITKCTSGHGGDA